MKKSIVFIGIIFLFLLIPTILLASINIDIKATAENNEIYVGNTTKVDFVATLTDGEYPSYYLTANSTDGYKVHQVSYSSDNNNIATVDDKGVVTGVSAGTATITVKVRLAGYMPNSLSIFFHCHEDWEGTLVDSTYTSDVRITVLPNETMYLCQPGSEPVPVQIAVNAASDEIQRINVGDSTDVGFSATLSNLKDPTVKYSLNKTNYGNLQPLCLGVSYSTENLAY